MKRSIPALLATFSLSLIAFPSMAKIPNNQQAKLSYAIGVQTGKAFKNHNVNVDPQLFAQGMKDAMSNGPLQMSEKAMAHTLAAFRKQSMQKMQAQMKEAAKMNAEKGEAFLAANKEKSGVKVTHSGLQYKVLKAGHGQSPSLASTVTVNYEGMLINGKIFDSSYKRGKPVTFPVRGVIKGWQEALTMMKPGAVWMIYIPADLAYGQQGAPGAIGPNETLIFKVNLISVK